MEQTKVLLLNPPTFENTPYIREGRCMQRKSTWTTVWPPISLVLIGTMLMEKGIDVKLIDSSVESVGFKELGEIIKVYKPAVIIINTATGSIKGDLYVAKLAKEINSKIKTAAFGIHVTVLPKDSLESEPDLDYVIMGEPELTAHELCLAIKNGENVTKIKGISYRENGEIICNPPREFISNLDILPFPNWNLINLNNYVLPFTEIPYLFIVTGRGCSYPCIFCTQKAYYGSKIRLRSIEKVVQEISFIKSKYHINNFMLWNESFSLNTDYVSRLTEKISEQNIEIRWTCTTRVNKVNFNLLKKMKEAGCWLIAFGIESGNQKILDNSKKEQLLEQSIEAVRAAKKAGLETVGHYIFGLPGETKETVKQTIEFAKKLDTDYAQFYCAVPFPGSELYNMAKKKWLNTNDWSKFEQCTSILNMEDISAKEIMNFRKIAFRQFYVRPSQIFKQLKKIKSVKEFRNFFRTAQSFNKNY